jgi:hypothetical protein
MGKESISDVGAPIQRVLSDDDVQNDLQITWGPYHDGGLMFFTFTKYAFGQR